MRFYVVSGGGIEEQFCNRRNEEEKCILFGTGICNEENLREFIPLWL